MRLPGDIDLGMALAVWRRNFAVYSRTWTMNILPNFFEPVLYLVGMGLGIGQYVGKGVGGESYFAFVAPGLLAAQAMNGASFETTYNVFVKMHFARLYDAFLCTPAQIQDVAMGELLWAVTRALVYGLAFIIVLLGFGAIGEPVIQSGWAVLLPLALALTGTCFGLLGLVFSASIRVIDMFSYYYTLFITPLFLFSGIFFPVADIPHGEAVAWWTPLYHAVRLCRGLAAGDVGATQGVSALWLLALSAVLLWMVPRRFARRLGR